MRAWDYKTGALCELLTKKEAIARGWAKESDNILGVKLIAVPIHEKSLFEKSGIIFMDGFDFFPIPPNWDGGFG